MLHKIRIIILNFTLLILTACDPQTGVEVNSPQIFSIGEGLDASLIAPAGFNITQEHYGFVQPETFSRIKIEEKELAYIPYTKSLTQENLLKNKLQLIKQEQIEIQGAICSLYLLRQNIAGTYYEKLWLISGDNLSSILVEASYPEGSNSKHKEAIKNSLLTLAVATDQNERSYTGLPFKLTATPGYKLKQRFLNSVVLESTESENNEPAIIVISHGATEQAIENIQTLSEHFLNNSKNYKNIDIVTNEMIKLNKIPALATTANVEVKDLPFGVYQVVSYQKERFLLVQGQSPKNKSANLKESVNKLLANFEFK